jgi:hypothetical protein
MEEEYRWLASQGVSDFELAKQPRESDEKDDYFFPQLPPSTIGPPPPYPPPSRPRALSPPLQTSPNHKDDDSLYFEDYLHSPPSSPPLPNYDPPLPPLEFYDIDLMKSSIGENEQPNDYFPEENPGVASSKSHLEVAVIEIPVENENSTESHRDLQDIEQFSVLRIGDRVYTVTTSLVLFLQNFILSGSRFLLRSYLNIEIPSQTREKLQEISDLSVRALSQLSTLKSLGECLTESCYFAADRTRTYTKWQGSHPSSLSLPIHLTLLIEMAVL